MKEPRYLNDPKMREFFARTNKYYQPGMEQRAPKDETQFPSQPVSEKVVQEILQKYEAIKDDPKRFKEFYFNDPVGFCTEVLGVTLWSKQQGALVAARDNPRVAIRSGHGVGKTFLAACLLLWWLYARQGLVITTAPTRHQVEGVLWREVHNLFNNALVHLPGLVNKSDLQVDERVWYAIGITTDTPHAFQGRHHEYLLVIVDEAPGVEETIHTQISTLVTGEKNVIVMIGNPTDTSGSFFEAFKRPHIWTCLKISCLEHPNVVSGREIFPGAVTRQWVEERKQLWGMNHPFWYSRVLGEFPKISTRGVIPLGWIERQTNEELRLKALNEAETEKFPRVGGLDVARYGDNLSVLTIRRGDAIESIEAWHHASLTETTGKAIFAIKEYGLSALVVDASGIGAGVVDRMLEQNAPCVAYNGGHRAFTAASFSNRRSEMWWHLRQRFEKGRIWLPGDTEESRKLVADLVTPEYELSSNGRLKVETKEQLLERGVASPDYADSLVLCFAIDEDPEEALRAPALPNQDPQAYEELVGVEEKSDFAQFPEGI